MTRKQSIFIFVAVSLLFSLLFFIIFGDQGLVDLNALKKERNQLAEKNELLNHENLTLSDEIDRLQNDPKYIENIARQELGMVGRDELILKPQSSSKQSNLH
ncbi:MAG: septum formation initiator family protein [Desulfobacterales bacterium]|jgi:cell division protein FtsB